MMRIEKLEQAIASCARSLWPYEFQDDVCKIQLALREAAETIATLQAENAALVKQKGDIFLELSARGRKIDTLLAIAPILTDLEAAAWARSWKRLKAVRQQLREVTGVEVKGQLTTDMERESDRT